MKNLRFFLLFAAVVLLTSTACNRRDAAENEVSVPTTSPAAEPAPAQTGGEIELINQSATVRQYTSSRGVYQWALELPSTATAPGIYLPAGDLPEAVRQDGMSVLVDGVLLRDSAWVQKPGANDIPENDFRARQIRVTNIRQQ